MLIGNGLHIWIPILLLYKNKMHYYLRNSGMYFDSLSSKVNFYENFTATIQISISSWCIEYYCNKVCGSKMHFVNAKTCVTKHMSRLSIYRLVKLTSIMKNLDNYIFECEIPWSNSVPISRSAWGQNKSILSKSTINAPGILIKSNLPFRDLRSVAVPSLRCAWKSRSAVI